MTADLVPVPSVVLDRLAAVGVDVARVLQHAGLALAAVVAGAADDAEFFAFWRVLEEVGGRRDLGLRLGSEASPHQLDVASLAALHSPNLGEALKKFARYKRLVCPEEVEIAVGNGEARIRFHWVTPKISSDDAGRRTFATVVALAIMAPAGGCAEPGRAGAPTRDEQTLARISAAKSASTRRSICWSSMSARSPAIHHAQCRSLVVMLPGLEAAAERR